MRLINSNKFNVGGLRIIAGAALFGLIPVFVRYGIKINIENLIFFRALFGSLFIGVFCLLNNNSFKINKKDIRYLIIWSAILLFAIVSYFYSIKKIDIGSAALILSFNSVFIIILSRYILNEKTNKKTTISLCLSIIGSVLILMFNINQSVIAIGYWAAISAAFWTGLNFVFPKKYLGDYPAPILTFYQSFFQLPFLLPFISINKSDFNSQNLLIFISLGVICTGLAFLLIYSGIKKTKSQFIGILQTSEIIVPIILGSILFNESLSINKIIGGVFIFLSYIPLLLEKDISTIK